MKIPHPLRGIRDDRRRRWRRQYARMVACTTQIVILTSLARKDLPEVRRFRLVRLVEKCATDCSPGRVCHALNAGGAVAERLRGRSFCLLLFCRVKREAENPFEIGNARIHLFPKIPTTRTERRGLLGASKERQCRKRRSLNARWIPYAQPRDFNNWCRDNTMQQTCPMAVLFLVPHTLTERHTGPRAGIQEWAAQSRTVLPVGTVLWISAFAEMTL
jgi:hypothetical protein